MNRSTLVDVTTYRSAGPDDAPFLAKIAGLFGQPDHFAERAWGEPWDSGIIAEEGSGSVGAAWYRRRRSDESCRELFVGVFEDARRHGIGTELLRHLVEAASDDEAIHLLMAVPREGVVPFSLPALHQLGFRRPGRNAPWLLGLHGTTLPPRK
jgi:GNAT superfamily N-acetyltransferase